MPDKPKLNQTQIKRIIRAYDAQGYAVSIIVRIDGSLEFTPVDKINSMTHQNSARPLF